MIRLLPLVLLAFQSGDWEKSFNAAKRKAGKTGQLVLVDFRVDKSGTPC